MIETGDVIIADLKSFLEQKYSLFILFGVLVGKSLAVVEFGVVWHQSYSIVEVVVGLLYLLEGEVGVSAVKEGTCVVGVESQRFVVLS
jgi:hypothetical protein